MLFADPTETALAAAVSKLAYCNPFLPDRIDCERAALGEEFVESDVVWNVGSDSDGTRPNIEKLHKRAGALADVLSERLRQGVHASEQELQFYEGLVSYLLYYRIHETLAQMVAGGIAKPQAKIAALFERFEHEAAQFLQIPGVKLPTAITTAHLFAIYFQVRRAFHHIFNNIVGSSMPAARLRAAIWQSIFTHDITRYRKVLFQKMGDFTTLITGPSGTGKELVARAIALSGYIPFDARTKAFSSEFTELFHPLNLSAMSPTLIESELFGHRRGAFTGALEDRTGWLEACESFGTVFLDEIGELDGSIQVKLLRVLQTRQFQRLGETRPREFKGKIIAATNRNLAVEMAQGRFRFDFYYRICSDIIRTPSLAEQLREAPQDLKEMVLFIARRLLDIDTEPLAEEVTQWISKNLGREYPWPGNFRELEQCVRNVLIRHEYHPQASAPTDAAETLAAEFNNGQLTADSLLRRYCTLVYRQTRSLEETSRRLGIDRRTVKSKVEPGELRPANQPVG